MNDENLLSIKEACEFIHISKSTLIRWDKEGILVPYKTTGGHRRYKKEELLNVINKKESNNQKLVRKRYTVGYCRVSTNSQKEDLERQVEVITKYCENNGYQFKIIRDIGSGINYKKSGFKELITLICTNKIDRLVINYKDRLVRFGYEIIEQLCEIFDVEIEIINLTDEAFSKNELVEDILSIITVFSAKLYGSRSHKNKKIVEENKKLFQDEKS